MESNFFAKNLKYIRKKEGLNQKDFATLINKQFSTISAYETGRATPTLDVLYQIAKILKLPIQLLLTQDLSLSGYNFTEIEEVNYKALKKVPNTSISDKDLQTVFSYFRRISLEKIHDYLELPIERIKSMEKGYKEKLMDKMETFLELNYIANALGLTENEYYNRTFPYKSVKSGYTHEYKKINSSFLDSFENPKMEYIILLIAHKDFLEYYSESMEQEITEIAELVSKKKK